MFKLNSKVDADSLLYSVILNEMATQYTCSLNSVYHPNWLVQWNCHCSHVYIPVHSPWVPGYISVVQINLVILTMAGFFPDRPRVPKYFMLSVLLKMIIKTFHFQIIHCKNIKIQLILCVDLIFYDLAKPIKHLFYRLYLGFSCVDNHAFYK